MDGGRDDFPLIPDVFGNMVKTDFVFLHMISLFEREIARTRMDCIDATEGGAHVRGTQVMTFEDVARRWGGELKPSYSELFHEIWSRNRVESMEGVIRGLGWLSGEAEEISFLCSRALAVTSPLIREIDEPATASPDLRAKIEEINRIADRLGGHGPFKDIVKDRLTSVLVRQFQSRFQAERAGTDRERLSIGIRQSHFFFEQMYKAAGLIHRTAGPVLEVLEQEGVSIIPRRPRR
jgi:hypothetical protein